MASASERESTPSASPNAPITRTSETLMAWLILTVGFAMATPPDSSLFFATI